MAGPNDFTGQNIQDSYQRVLQISSSGQITDGTGSVVTLASSAVVSASHALTASYAISASHEITYELSSSYAQTASVAQKTQFPLSIGTGLDLSNSATNWDGQFLRTLTLDLTEVIANDSANNFLTSDGDGTLTAETNLEISDSGDVVFAGGELIGSGSRTGFQTSGFISGSTIIAENHITASGDISASGDVYAESIILPFGQAVNWGAHDGNHISVDSGTGNIIFDTLPVQMQNGLELTGTNGHISASGNISASGDIIGAKLIVGNPGTPNIDVADWNNVSLLLGDFGNSITMRGTETILNNGGLDVQSGHITASGNISASGIINASQLNLSNQHYGDFNGTLFRVGASAPSEYQNDLSVGSKVFFDASSGHITSSGNISSSGYIYAGGDIHAVGDVVASSTTPSDYRLKENIKHIEGPLEKVLNLEGKEFDWKKSGESDYGLIAQDVEKIIPKLVKEKNILGAEETQKVVNYISIIPLLIESIKELNNKIEEIKNG